MAWSPWSANCTCKRWQSIVTNWASNKSLSYQQCSRGSLSASSLLPATSWTIWSRPSQAAKRTRKGYRSWRLSIWSTITTSWSFSSIPQRGSSRFIRTPGTRSSDSIFKYWTMGMSPFPLGFRPSGGSPTCSGWFPTINSSSPPHPKSTHTSSHRNKWRQFTSS